MRGEDRRARSSDPRPLTDFRGRQLAASNRRFVTRRRTGKSLFPTIHSDVGAEPREREREFRTAALLALEILSFPPSPSRLSPSRSLQRRSRSSALSAFIRVPFLRAVSSPNLSSAALSFPRLPPKAGNRQSPNGVTRIAAGRVAPSRCIKGTKSMGSPRIAKTSFEASSPQGARGRGGERGEGEGVDPGPSIDLMGALPVCRGLNHATSGRALFPPSLCSDRPPFESELRAEFIP